MCASEFRADLHEIASIFDQLALKLDEAAEALAHHETAGVELAALRRSKDAAERGAKLTRQTVSVLRERAQFVECGHRDFRCLRANSQALT